MASSLHNHSEYSVLDGFSHPEEYLQRAQEIGLNAFAITEHGNQYSWIYFDKLKSKYPNIKMIYGVELYECFDITVKDQDSKYFHLVALAKNEKGRIALNEIITKSNFDGFYYKPRVDLDMLKPYAENIIILSACLASKISREKDFDICVSYVNEYKSIFPYFFLEMQSHKTIDQAEYNKKILKLSELTNTPFTITTDSHSATKEDLYYQARHVQIARDSETMTEIYDDCYVQSEEEIHAIMDCQIGKENVSIGIEMSDYIADMIEEVNMPFQSPQLPTFPLPDGFNDNYEYLKYLCEEGWEVRNIDKMSQEDQETRRKRLDYELGIIHQMGFDGYFLIVWDFIKWAKTHDVYVGDGRGCFIGDSDVLLANGQTKKIKDVDIGDCVVTHNGNAKRVANRFEYNCSEEMYSIKHSYFEPIKCTYNHKIFAVKQGECYRYSRVTDKTKVRKFCSNSCKKYRTCLYKQDFVPSWVEARDLEVGDYICYPKNKKLDNVLPLIIDLSNYDNSLQFDEKYVWYNNPLTGSKRDDTVINRFIAVNKDFCELAGLFISQGFSKIVDKSTYEIGFAHNSENVEVIKKNIQLLENIFGTNKTISVRKFNEKKCKTVVFHSKVIAILFKKLFGSNAKNKHIPNLLIDAMDTDCRNGMIKGLWNGDGSYKATRHENKTRYSTINLNLAYQVQMILAKENIYSSITRRIHKYNDWNNEYGTVVNSGKNIEKLNEICDDKFEKNNKKNGTCRILQDDNYIYFPIIDINTFAHNGKVYDLNVEDDHSYVVNNAAVHNSGGGSIVDYLLGISQLDPITYNLIFERFLNPERVSMPDIDTDFSDREKVVDYLMNEYGADRVCQVINYSYITPVVAIKDVGRVLKIPYKVCDKISKKFTYPTFQECIDNNPSLYEEYADYKELFDIAGKISGRVRQTSVHAGGVGIVDTKITDYMAMKIGSKGEHVIQVDKKNIEEIGIIKFDCLGLADTLNTIKYAVEYAGIDEWEININNPEFLNNKDMYDLLCSAKTNGVFQVESQGMKDLLLRLQPSNLEDVSAVLALYRPDSMGALDEYIECKHGRKEAEYIHPDMEPILESTYGCMIYQEEMMDIVRKFGGRTYGGADVFRKAVGKILPF